MRLKNEWQIGVLLGLMVVGAGCASTKGSQLSADVDSPDSNQSSVAASNTPTNLDFGKVTNTSAGQSPIGFDSSSVGQSSSGNGTPPSNGASTGDPMNQ